MMTQDEIQEEAGLLDLAIAQLGQELVAGRMRVAVAVHNRLSSAIRKLQKLEAASPEAMKAAAKEIAAQEAAKELAAKKAEEAAKEAAASGPEVDCPPGDNPEDGEDKT